MFVCLFVCWLVISQRLVGSAGFVSSRKVDVFSVFSFRSVEVDVFYGG